MKYSKQIHWNLVVMISKSVRIGTAAQTCGINKSTFYDWIKRGRTGEEPFLTFMRDVEQARSTSEAAVLQRIHEAGQRGEWKADAWLLENSYEGYSPDKGISEDEMHKRLLNAGYAPLALPDGTEGDGE